MNPLSLAAIGVVVMTGAAAIIFFAMRQAAARRDELITAASARGWCYVASTNNRTEGSFRVEGTSPAGLAWIITAWSLQSDSHRARFEFIAKECSAATTDFAIGPAKEIASMSQLATLGENHPLAAKLLRGVGSRAGGVLALGVEGTPVAPGSFEFRNSFGALVPPGGTLPVHMTAELERLFLQWPEPFTDPGNKVSAWRDAKGLHVSVLCDSAPPFELIEHLAALGVALAESTARG